MDSARGAAGDALSTAWLAVKLLAAIPLTLLFSGCVACYWAFCDIGINAAANSFTLVFFVAPVMLVLFALVAYFSHRPVRRPLGVGFLRAVLPWLIGAMFVFAGSFAAIVWSGAGSCNPHPGRGAAGPEVDLRRIERPGAGDGNGERWSN